MYLVKSTESWDAKVDAEKEEPSWNGSLRNYQKGGWFVIDDFIIGYIVVGALLSMPNVWFLSTIEDG